jgi:hypothetical protein
MVAVAELATVQEQQAQLQREPVEEELCSLVELPQPQPLFARLHQQQVHRNVEEMVQAIQHRHHRKAVAVVVAATSAAAEVIAMEIYPTAVAAADLDTRTFLASASSIALLEHLEL